MSTFIDNLDKLNRKERFFLIGMTLGTPSFKLDRIFRQKLSEEFSVVIPDNVFVAMDYHLNWIYAAAALTFSNPVRDKIFDNKSGIIDGTQEDVDLLVAFEDASGICHLIMLEAKGVTAFSNRQFKHKMDRFRSIFGENGKRFLMVKPYFGLVSPRKSTGLLYDLCPSWLKHGDDMPWLEMSIPQDRLTVFGCDEHGRPSQKRAFWAVRKG